MCIYSTNVEILSPSSYRTELSISIDTPGNIYASLQMKVSQTGTWAGVSQLPDGSVYVYVTDLCICLSRAYASSLMHSAVH